MGAKNTPAIPLNEDLEIAYLPNAQIVKSTIKGFWNIDFLHFSEYNRFATKILKYGFLKSKFYGNSILSWCIALGILIISFVLVKVLYWVFSNIIRRLTSKTKTNLDDVLIDKLEKPLTYLLIILGYWISIHYLSFSKK